jgi:hypothetical protein
MADDDKEEKDILDSLEREASDFAKVCFHRVICSWHQSDPCLQDAEIDRIRQAFSLDA